MITPIARDGHADRTRRRLRRAVSGWRRRRTPAARLTTPTETECWPNSPRSRSPRRHQPQDRPVRGTVELRRPELRRALLGLHSKEKSERHPLPISRPPNGHRVLGRGNQALTVATMGLGCMGMSEFYGSGAAYEVRRTIHRALESSCTRARRHLLDKAHMYGPFTNERLVGGPLRTVASRSCSPPSPATSVGRTAVPRNQRSPDYVRSACDASLQRLGLEHIDLYYQHRVDQTVPIKRPLGPWPISWSQGRCVPRPKRGFGRYCPPSPCRASDHRAANRVLAMDSAHRGRDPAHDPRSRHRIVPYSPLGRGFLTGTITSTEGLAEAGLPPLKPAVLPRGPRREFEDRRGAPVPG